MTARIGSEARSTGVDAVAQASFSAFDENDS
jgi:hypothetical protein